MELSQLPDDVQQVCRGLTSGLLPILGDKLYGAYLYGAAVFPDAGRIQDIDCHVILKTSLTDRERDQILSLHANLAQQFSALGSELDVYYILLTQAQKLDPPTHQLRTEIKDESWALHCAHIRAGYYAVLYGPVPTEIFPEPAWTAIKYALDFEIRFILKNLQYPAYCALNLCRVLYSFSERNVAVSKRFSGGWVRRCFPHWRPLIDAALRTYEGLATVEDDQLLNSEIERFLEFAIGQIRAIRDKERITDEGTVRQ